jgi:hypothetical protein
MIAVCCSSQLACHDPRLAAELVEVLCLFNKGLSPVCSSNTGPLRHPCGFPAEAINEKDMPGAMRLRGGARGDDPGEEELAL